MTEREFATHPNMVGRLRRVGAAMIADTAVVVGDVRLGRDVSIWFGAVVRGDDCWIEIGDGTNIQDNTVVHVDVGAPHRIGRGVTIGHGVVMHGVEVGDHSLIGIGAMLLSGSRVGRHCVIGAGALLPEGVVIPDRSLVLGIPGKVRRQVSDAEVQRIEESARHYVGRAQSYLGS